MCFSVVIPLYNKAPYIKRTIMSVLSQTCQASEIIVVNDGSTDDGGDIVGTIHDSRIRLIEQPNQGVSAARNRGVEAAVNDFVAFLDADDEWLPDFLQNIQKLIDDYPGCGAYLTALQTIRPNGDVYLPNLSKLPPEPWSGVLPNCFELFQDRTVFYTSSMVVPKNVLIEAGGFPVSVHLLEDISCWVKIALRYPIAFSTKRLAVYHQEAGNRSNSHKNLKEAPFISTIQQAVKDGSISQELQKEAMEFVAQQQIFTATANVMEGNPEYARQLLATCHKTRKYRRLWLWWRFWAAFPAGWPRRFLALKQKLSGYAG